MMAFPSAFFLRAKYSKLQDWKVNILLSRILKIAIQWNDIYYSVRMVYGIEAIAGAFLTKI